MVLRFSLITILFLVSTTTQAKLPKEVLVNLFSTQKIYKITVYPPSRINGKVLQQKHQITFQNLQNKIYLTATQGNLIIISSNNSSPRGYAGTITLERDFQKGVLKVINKVSSEKYLKSVLASETGGNWPLEASKAQAVVLQTRLAKYKGQILPDSTEEGVYYGNSNISPIVSRALKETWGQILIQNSKVIEAYYHSTCAGNTSSASLFSGARDTFTKATKCNYCSKSPFWKETVKIVPQKEYKLPIPIGATYDNSGRPLIMKLSNGNNINGYQYWLLLGLKHGWDKAPGLNYRVQKVENNIIIKSRGAGHGIGLCQWGAKEMAIQGKNYKQILQFYFEGTEIKPEEKQ